MKIATISATGLRLLGLVVFSQAAIVVTGALVRLTGSGLGCPTWPQCAADSFVPVESQVEGFHKWIEFGNRLLTFVVFAIAILSFAYLLYQRRKRRSLPKNVLKLAAIPVLGTIAQAILGGITVLTDLNPYTVAAHFLLSIVIIYFSVLNRIIAEFPAIIYKSANQNILARLLLLVGSIVIFLGVITTGSGPHAGDEVAQRFSVDTQIVAWLHADMVWLFTGLIIASYFVNRNLWLYKLTITVFLQMVVGYSQWFTDLPWGLVAIHVALAVTLWVFLVKYVSLVGRVQ
jgi:cytochrome c oxidase assembly protein subunit 15